ncbi:glycosyltransferase family 4 protein [Marinobacter sp. F3R08]|uniref:glycosyltransferase family 4 protein n=1 Tax=Marinobacter sp. F3R08 TaxID=2841559 RepID=UPI001C08A0BC|nr:glycosyltransferase family 4 protein [Marinobacter sp. F3R08]MBU2955902.1 glycosyltransferase family 4 protein [Marinobacter sp. F3R08]
MTTQINATLTVSRFWPARGGSEMHSRELAHALTRAGHDIQVICHSSTDTEPTELALTRESSIAQQDGHCMVYRECPTGPKRQALRLLALNHQRFRSVRPLFDQLLRTFSTRTIQRRSANAQVIHSIYNGLTSVAESSLAAARNQGVPFIWSPLANTDLPQGLGWSSRRFRKLYQEADALIALTRHEQEWLVAQGAPQERTFVCPMGPMVASPSPVGEFRKRHSIGNDPYVLFLGRHDEAKGYQRLLQAADFIWRSRPDTRLVFIGPQTELSRASFQEHTDPRITVIEEISQADKNAALAGCELLCVPSDKESLGVVYLEAWHYRKPVVALDIPVLQSVISHGVDGLLCRSDSTDLARAVIRLLAEPAYRQHLGEAGHNKLERDYSWPSIVQKHQEIYAFALATPKPA